MEGMGLNMKYIDYDFYKGKKVLITGHTGFKGTWISHILINAGAEITGYALLPKESPSLFELVELDKKMNSIIGDIRDYQHLQEVFEKVKPEIVIHLAAQPIVRESYVNPRDTYEINVMGTVNVLECVRHSDSVKSFLNVTTDKVYKNREWSWGYREIEELDGFDPYSNSKSCSELVTHSYIDSFFGNRSIAISTARAGNVIGGGDFAQNRIIPDCIRTAIRGGQIEVRNSDSIRPYQHVLESIVAYLMIAQYQYKDIKYSGYYNVGPDENDCVSTGVLADLFCEKWGNIEWINKREKKAPHEANYLKLDCSKIKSVFGWKPTWNIERAVMETVNWTKAWVSGQDIWMEMDRQIREYLEEVY